MNGRNPHPPPTVAPTPPPPPRRPPRLVKIVRDGVERLVGDCHVRYRQVSSEDHVRGLRKKLIEEAVEYMEDPSLGELADVFEVIRALAKHDLGLTMQDVIGRSLDKYGERGGFDQGVGLFITTTPESSTHG